MMQRTTTSRFRGAAVLVVLSSFGWLLGCGPSSPAGGGDPTGGDGSDGDTVDACPEGEELNFDGTCCPTLPAACKYSCTIDVAASTHDCNGSAASITSLTGNAGTAVVDMSDYESLTVLFNVCDPTGWVMHLADSPSCDGYGGDSNEFENDAELYLTTGTLQMISSELAPAGYGELLSQSFVPTTGCAARAFTAEDQRIRSFGPCMESTSEYGLRINPPFDAQGSPDALWYLGMNRTHGNPTRTGQGLQSVTLCFRQ